MGNLFSQVTWIPGLHWEAELLANEDDTTPS